MTEYVNPSDYHPGDTILTENGEEHIVENVVGNVIVTTDGLHEIIPISDEEE